MKKILVPTDFSDGAFNALIHAIHISKILDASIQIVHAYSMPATASNVMVDITDVLKKNAEEELDKFKIHVERPEISQGVDIEYKAIYGSVIDVINRLSLEDSIDLVVMGTHGASGITEKWLGSNTAAAARNVDKPIMAIPADTAYKSLDKILFSTDMKVMKETVCLDFVADLARKTSAQVKFFHVRDSKEPTDNRAYKEQIANHFEGLDPTFTVTYNDKIAVGINETIKVEKPSLLVVVRHDYGFFESIWHSSVSRQVLNSAALPILVLND